MNPTLLISPRYTGEINIGCPGPVIPLCDFDTKVLPSGIVENPRLNVFGIEQLNTSVNVNPSHDVGFNGFGSYTGLIFATVPTASWN